MCSNPKQESKSYNDYYTSQILGQIQACLKSAALEAWQTEMNLDVITKALNW